MTDTKKDLPDECIWTEEDERKASPVERGVSYASFVEGLKELMATWRETGNGLPVEAAFRYYKCADDLEEYMNGDYSVIERKKHS